MTPRFALKVTLLWLVLLGLLGVVIWVQIHWPVVPLALAAGGLLWWGVAEWLHGRGSD